MENRLLNIRKLLREEKLDAFLVSSAVNIFYITGFDGLHSDEREGYTLITQKGLYLFASPLTAEGARKNARGVQVIELTRNTRLIPSLQKITDQEKLQTIGFEENLTYSEYARFKKLKGVKLKLVEELIEQVRVDKDPDELASLKKACELTDQTFLHIQKYIKAGIRERDLAWEIEKYIREHKGELAFPTIVAFGKNSAVPHHKTGQDVLKKDSIVLLDFGAKVDGYHADMSRTIFFGNADEKFKKLYAAVFESQMLPYELFHKRPSQPLIASWIDKVSRDHITALSYPSIPHSVGHGVGLAIHELPHISTGFDEEIHKNTAFTVEPGIYIAGHGGVRIEDTVYFDGKKIIQLTNSPKRLIELR